MKNCETCLWGCFELDSTESLEEGCEHYYAINEDETFDEEYIENMRLEFMEEWDVYLKDWN
jgi:hypothetical protein